MKTVNGFPCVPWARINGKPMYTNGILEDALKLTPVMIGWCKEGVYARDAVMYKNLKSRVEQIDWRRVRIVTAEFGIYLGTHIYMMPAGPWRSGRYLTERRYQKLMAACDKAVSVLAFGDAINDARAKSRAPTDFAHS